MIYTSGTTGWPKGVRRAPRSAEAEAEGARAVRGIFGLDGWEGREDQMVLVLPGPP